MTKRGAVRSSQTSSRTTITSPLTSTSADWDFRGNAKMARFGFVLGWLASEQPKPVEWQAGDEFEAARKASEAH